MKRKSLDSTLYDLQKKYVVHYIYSALAILAFHFFVYWTLDIRTFSIGNAIGFGFHLMFLLFIHRLRFQDIRPLINLYLIFISIYLYFFTSFLWQISSIALIWYFIIPMAILNVFHYKMIIYWSLFIFLLFMLTMVTPSFYSLYIPNESIIYINICTVICVLYLICFIAFYNEKVIRCNTLIYIKKARESNPIHYFEEDEEEKYKVLFDEIVKCFEENKPFQDPDFNILQLASTLKSNGTYISRAVNMNTKMNFKTFVNTYRINQVKELLNDKNYDKYTLMYIYTSSGFKHQSTFNKVFKQIEGITPSEYINNLKNNYSDDESV